MKPEDLKFADECVARTEEAQHSTISSMQIMFGFLLAGFSFLHPTAGEKIKWVILVGIVMSFIGLLLTVAYHTKRTNSLKETAQKAHDPNYQRTIKEIKEGLDRADSIYDIFGYTKIFSFLAGICFVGAVLFPLIWPNT